MSELAGIARFKINEGKVEEFKRLSAEAMEIVKTKDTGTLRYDTYFNDDESECVILEMYRDSQAAIEHAEHLGELSAAVLAIVSVVHGELLGEPSEEIRSRLASSESPSTSRPTSRCRDLSPTLPRSGAHSDRDREPRAKRSSLGGACLARS